MYTAVKDFIISSDVFGSPYSLDHKQRSQYQSAVGGILFIVLLLVLISFFVIGIKSIIENAGLSIIYYSMKFPSTEEISFKNYSSSFAIGLVCSSDEYTDEEIYRMVEIKANYVKMVKVNGEYNKEKKNIPLVKCDHERFYHNRFNSQFDALGLSGFYCVENEDDLDYKMIGIYSNEEFSYYEIGIDANVGEGKEFSEKHITDLLKKSECDYSIYWVDLSIDSFNYKKPVSNFLDGSFIALEGDSTRKMNIYFKALSFNSDEDLLFNSRHPNYYLAYDYNEEYDAYKGDERFQDQFYGYTTLGKLYLRASLYRGFVERKYIKITEFFANMSSIFSTAFALCKVIMGYINIYKSRQEIIKQVFNFREEIKNRNHPFIIGIKALTENKTMKMSPLVNINNKNKWIQLNNYISQADKKNEESKKEEIEESKKEEEEKKVNNSTVNIMNKKDSSISHIIEQEKNFNMNCLNSSNQIISSLKRTKRTGIANRYSNQNSNRVDFDITFKYFIGTYFPNFVNPSLKDVVREMNLMRKFISQELDIVHYLKVIQDFEFLKNCFFKQYDFEISFLTKNNILLLNRFEENNEISLLAPENEKEEENETKKEVNKFFDNFQKLAEKTQKTNYEEVVYNEILEQIS